MKSKKTLSIITCALFSFGLAVPVYAQAGMVQSDKSVSIISSTNTSLLNTVSQNNSKISKEDAKNIAKKFFKDYLNITINDTEYQSNISYNPNYMSVYSEKNYIWQMSWNKYSQDKNININISVDATTGKVLNVDNMKYSNGQTTTIATITEDRAKEIGENFLNKINSQEFSQCKLVNNNQVNMMKGSQTIYSFVYFRTINGIPFWGNTLSVGVDGVTGEISSYQNNWGDDKIPKFSKDSIISKDKVDKIFNDGLKLKLGYIACIDQSAMVLQTPILKLVYMLDPASTINIDAKDGKELNLDNKPIGSKTKDLDVAKRKALLNSYKPVQKLKKELDSDSAESIIKQIVKDTYGECYDIQSISYQNQNNMYGQNTSSWSGQFIEKKLNNGMDVQGYINIDSFTGEVLSLNKYNPYDKGIASDATSPKKLTWEQGYDKAIESIKKYFPNRVKDITTQQTYTPQIDYYNGTQQVEQNYNYNFSRLLNGLPYQNDSINITMNASTGELEGVYANWTQDLKVPLVQNSMSQIDAQKIYLKKYSPELQYTLINTSKDIKKPNMEVKLGYSILGNLQYNQYNNIDAISGKFVDYNGQEIDNNLNDFKKIIKGSPVEKELSILASQGIINTKDFSLSKKLTRLELIKMLVNAKGYAPYGTQNNLDLKINYSGAKGDETYKYLQMAVTYGALDNSGDFNGAESVTREEMIKDIIKLLGYDKIAKSKDIFVLSYSDIKDINPDDIGYIALSKSLGLTDTTKNKFRPKDIATITDAAFSIFKALDSLKK